MFKHFVFEFNNEWLQLFSKHNWYTFTPIAIEFENDEFTGGLEFTAFLLGLGIRIRYNTKKFYEKQKEWDAEVQEAIKANGGMTIQDFKDTVGLE